MRKDPTEFRKRFAAWKNGKLPYEAGLPKYADGKGETVTDYPIPFIKDKVVKLTDAGLATGAVFSTNLLDSIADNADRAGLDLLTALGLATKESTLGNPTDDRSMRTLLSALRQKELTDHLLEVYGLSYDLLFGLHINRGDIVRGQELINWYNDKNNIEHKPSPPLSTTHPDRKSVIQKAFEFYKQHPDKYNPGQKNYQRLVDKRGAEVMGSPEVLKWLKERNIKKATGRFNRLNPLLNESKLNPTKYKDGKLPGYYLGTEGDNIEELIKRRLEQRSDATTVQRQEPVQPIKRNFITEAQRKHAAEAVGPDTRSSYQRKQSLAAKLYANQQYQKAKDDAKRAEGMDLLMKTISPSTYVEAATGLDLGTVGRLITDAAAFGLPGAIKSIAGPTMQYGRNFLLSQTMRRSLNKNPMLRTYNSSPQYLDTGGNVLKYLDYIESLFPNSKVKDIVYHSTWAKPFELFDPSKIKRGYGFYFSPSENHLPFDRMVYSKVDIRNPLEIFPNKNRDLDVSGLWRKELTEKAIKEGLHDGVIGVSNMRNPGEPEIVALNPDQVHILGSQLDRNQFAGFMRKLNRKSTIKDGYIYKNRTVTPGEYKYYGQKVNYSDPSKNELSDYQLDDMMGDYIGRGAERTVYQDLRNNNRVLKITDGGSPDVQITNQNDLLDYVDESLRINNLPEVPRLSYEGFIKDGNRYLPVFSLQKVTPLKKVADPFLVFTRQYVLPNGKTPSGKLSAIRRMNPDALSRIGYKPIPTKPGVYSVNGIGGPYNVTDLGLKNIGIDALGNLKIFDPLFE